MIAPTNTRQNSPTNPCSLLKITLYNANGGLVLDWAVVVDNGVAYWYINGELAQTLENPKLESFNIGALQMNAFISDIELYVQAENADAYNAVVSEYLG